MKISLWGPEYLAQVLECDSLTSVLQWMCTQPPHMPREKPKVFSYSELAQKLGYQSRSYIREVIRRKKRPNKMLVERLCGFVQASANWRRFFTCLFEIETTKNQKHLAMEGLETIRQKLHKQISIRKIDGQMKGMEGVITEREGRYHTRHSHVLIERLQSSEVFYKDLRSMLKNLLKQLEDKSVSKEEVLYLSTFSISKKNMFEFKKKLTDLLTEFVDASEFSDGDQVVHLASFLTFNR